MESLFQKQELPSLFGTDPAYSRKIKALLSIIASSVPFETDMTKLAKTIGLARNSVIADLQGILWWTGGTPLKSAVLTRHSDK